MCTFPASNCGCPDRLSKKSILVLNPTICKETEEKHIAKLSYKYTAFCSKSLPVKCNSFNWSVLLSIKPLTVKRQKTKTKPKNPKAAFSKALCFLHVAFVACEVEQSFPETVTGGNFRKKLLPENCTLSIWKNIPNLTSASY